MTVHVRAYRPDRDFDAISQFLVDIFSPDDNLKYWPQPRWEYMHSHPYIGNIEVTLIGVAEAPDGSIVGVVHPEHAPAFAYLQASTPKARLPLLHWAEEHLGGWSETFQCETLGFYVDDTDSEMRDLLEERGYEATEWIEPNSRMLLDRPIELPEIPDGYSIQSLADENDLSKIHHVLWRGFDHEGEPPPEGVTWREQMQDTPGFRPELNIVAVGPDGGYAAYAGLWYVEDNRMALVEPVATDPEHRRLGLATAVVLEGVRRTKELGASIAWVGADMPVYRNMGFEYVGRSTLWLRP